MNRAKRARPPDVARPSHSVLQPALRGGGAPQMVDLATPLDPRSVVDVTGWVLFTLALWVWRIANPDQDGAQRK